MKHLLLVVMLMFSMNTAQAGVIAGITCTTHAGEDLAVIVLYDDVIHQTDTEVLFKGKISLAGTPSGALWSINEDSIITIASHLNKDTHLPMFYTVIDLNTGASRIFSNVTGEKDGLEMINSTAICA